MKPTNEQEAYADFFVHDKPDAYADVLCMATDLTHMAGDRCSDDASQHVARQDGATQDGHAKDIRELRQQCELEKVAAVKHAEESLRARFKSTTETEEKIFQDQRRKMMAQLEQDREQVRQTLIDERKQLEADLKSARESEEKSTAALRAGRKSPSPP